MDVAARGDSNVTPAAPRTARDIPDLQPDLQRSLPLTESEDLSLNLQVLHEGEQLDEMRAKRGTFAKEANRLRRRKEEWPVRITELEQQLQEAREHGDEASEEYEKVQAEAVKVAEPVGKMEKETQGVDVDLLQ
ncbi:hypothetical protein LTR17_026142 [Elasticomyces elasticus]|nr:hypothetical protein LTR17_026142 [Elasticomyces elasticus]